MRSHYWLLRYSNCVRGSLSVRRVSGPEMGGRTEQFEVLQSRGMRILRALHSLKGRLALFFGSMLACAIVISVVLFYRQHQINRDGAARYVRASEQMADAVEIRELLRAINKQIRFGLIDPNEFARLESLIGRRPGSSAAGSPFNQFKAEIAGYRSGIDSYQLGKTNVAALNRSYTSTLSALDALIESDQRSIYRIIEDQHYANDSFLRIGIYGFFVFILVALAFGYRMISLATGPFSSMVRFLDELDIEQDHLPKAGPKLRSEFPEIGEMSKSFERFLKRIWGYRVLNVRRLLVEKRKADVLSACISDGILLLSGDRIEYVNLVGEKIIGARFREVPAGQSLSALLKEAHGAENPGVRAILSAISRSISVEFSLVEDGHRRHFLIQARALAQDSEIQDLGLFDQFQTGAEELGDKLHLTMLIVAQDVTLVRESQEAKGHFLATLSHEIKTPVTSLTMATRLLHRSSHQIPNPSQRALVQTCAEDVDRLRGLLGDFLSISSFDTLTQRLEIQNVDLGRLLKNSVQSFKIQAKDRVIDLSCEVLLPEGKPVIVAMDPAKIAWAISNLLTNALRHTPKGGKINVKLQVCEGSAEVRVRDTGPGIDRKRQAQIFEKFNSFYDIRIARSGSIGVGLAIAREIVTAHSGRIWVSSELGRGAEFCFTLPIKMNAAEKKTVESLMNSPSQTAIGKGAARGTSASS